MATRTFGAGWADKFSKWLVGEPSSEGEYRAFCPIHEEPGVSQTPSASFNFAKGQFYCFGGCGGMPINRLWQSLEEDQPAAKVRSLDDKRQEKEGTAPKVPLPTKDELDGFVEVLLASPRALKIMREKRGYTVETIRRFQIGNHKGRFTIPVYDEAGELVNVRKYLPDAQKASDKMLPWAAGYGERRLFLPDALVNGDDILLTEGETDAILARQFGFNAMSHTAGATAWQEAWSHQFEGKHVFVCYDVDKAGREGAEKVANSVSKFAEGAYIVNLPMRDNGSDITDFFVNQGGTAEAFQELLERARSRPYGASAAKVRVSTKRQQEPKPVTLQASQDAAHVDEPLEIVATIAGKVQPSYLMPRRVTYTCGEDWSVPKCSQCAVKGHREEVIPSDAPVLLDMINKGQEARRKTLMKIPRIPGNCPRVEIDEPEQWNVEELVLVPDVATRVEEQQTPIQRKLYNVGRHDTPINTTARITGVNLTDPNTGRAILQSWACDQVQTDLDQFVMTPELLQALKVFRPRKKQTPLNKMQEIAYDLEANVTRIYGRPLLHIAYDIVWHSVMDFSLNGVRLGKGWVELLVVGDTRTGKSEAALRLCDHYRAGILKSCEGATLPGLVGGAQQMGSNWMVTWGTIPLNDRRLVVLDEFSGIADKGIIEQMSSVRSSGRAQITKIVSQETSARTRLIWISNPADGRAIIELPNGAIEAIRTLIKNPEDIARFDLAMSASSADVQSTVINSVDHPEIPHRYTTDLCSSLVAWAWSRKADQVMWAEGVESFLMERAEEMGGRYVPEPPLVQGENVRVKLARVAVAIAARLFSTDETGEMLVVTKAHVRAAEELMDSLYGMVSFGYLDHSRKVIRNRERAQANIKAARTYLTLHKEDVFVGLQSVLGSDFRVRDFEDFAGMHKDDSQTAIRELQGFKMVRRMAKGYIRMEPALVSLIKELEDKWESV
jgi:hypothetical protein